MFQKRVQNPILDQELQFLFSFDKSVTVTCKKMANMKLKFEDFQGEKLSKNQQKMVLGGDPPPPPVDPGKKDNNGNG
ncbi:hypothetical protein J2Y38_001086 [Flavobacterium sp. 2755]|nr:hypothetical protein [Flavobacterium sp. 2755]